MVLTINKASDSDEEDADEEPEWNDPTHLIDMACARVTMLIRIGPMTEHKYWTLQVFTSNTYIAINNYITNKSSQLLLLVIFLMRCSATSSTMLSTRAGATGARARARTTTSRFLL